MNTSFYKNGDTNKVIKYDIVQTLNNIFITYSDIYGTKEDLLKISKDSGTDFDANRFPEKYFAVVSEGSDNQFYIFDKTNEFNEETGYFKEVNYEYIRFIT